MSGTEASDLISLPSAGGAVRGLGEKFTPDPHTGTGNFTVPIPLPPGRNGFGPELALLYSTGGGGGPFGQGWSLSVPGVARRTDRGVPRYDDGSDVFVLAGAEDLVAIGGGAFRPRTEGLFARIDHRSGGPDDVWVVWGKDGLVSTYGTPGAAGADPAVVADPDDPTRIFRWLLTSTVDQFGNRIEYHYDHETGDRPPHRWSQAYLREVRYADVGDRSEPDFLITARFTYEQRPDPSSQYRAGFEIRTARRCIGVEVFTHAGERRLVSSLRLEYHTDGGNGVSQLRSVRLTGHDGERTQSLPPLEFGYTTFQPDGRRLVTVNGFDLPAGAVGAPGFELADLTGDGLPDLLELGDAARFWRNLGDGRFDRPRSIPDAPAGIRLGGPGVRLLDADGDGRPDLMVTQPRLAGYFPMRFDGLFDRRSFHGYRAAPSIDLTDPEVRLIDLTGDGVTDALRTGGRLECFFNDPEDGWTEVRAVPRRALGEFPDVSFADPRVRLADMSGDGLTDIAYVTDTGVSYWPSRGRGDWGPRIRMTDSPRLPLDHDPDRVLLGDVDGDGRADLIYVDDHRVTLWINRSGNGWGDPIEVRGTPRMSTRVTVRLVDLLGTGVPGVLWSDEDRSTLYFLDLTGGTKPYLLAQVVNNLGAVTQVEYGPSTRFAVADAARPATRWRTPLPFPVQVVTRVRSVDAISGNRLTTAFAYHHGYWDGVEREFRGFGRVDQRDTEVIEGEFFSPPIETRTWFHQGALGDRFDGPREADYVGEYWRGDPPALPATALPTDVTAAQRRDALRGMRGRVLRTELYALDDTERADRPYTVAEYGYAVRREADGVFFPHRVATRSTQWERGDDPSTSLTFVDGYDQFGFPTGETAVAVPRGRDYRSAVPATPPYLATQTENSYAHRSDAVIHLLGRVATQRRFEIVNDGTPTAFELAAAAAAGASERVLVAATRNHYDGTPFEGLGVGRLGAHGVLTRAETLVLTPEVLAAAYGPSLPAPLDPNAPPDGHYPGGFTELLAHGAGYVQRAEGLYAVTSQRRYDCQGASAGARGLLVASRDPLGNQTTVAYDPHAMFAVTLTDPAGMVTSAEIDYRVLRPCEVTDPNGNRAAVAFSPLGLVEKVAMLGKLGGKEGDTLDEPGTHVHHDLLAFAERGQPVSVRTVRRVQHVNAQVNGAPAGDRDAVLESVEYSDGFGRPLQARHLAEDLVFDETGPGALNPRRARVTGATVYDNKGRVVRSFEPYFDSGLDYAAPGPANLGAAVTTRYDPRGQVVRTVNPDGSEQRVIYGVPTSLDGPDRFVPTPWEAFRYDEQDNATRTHDQDHPHADTPSSVEFDALGRPVRAVVRAGPDPGAEWFTTLTSYDIRGNPLTVTDALGRVALRQVYDLANRPLRVDHIDTGVRSTVLDAAGGPVETRDARGALTLRGYDSLRRPVRLWARDAADEPVTLRERVLFGDSAEADLDTEAAAADNLLGRVFQHFDEAGVVTTGRYDIKGNPVESVRRVIADAVLTATDGFRVDWQPAAAETFAQRAEQLLDPLGYVVNTVYDALGRPVLLTCPADVEQRRRELRPRYDRAGALVRIEIDRQVVVERIGYNARGQRVLAAFGNGLLTRYDYDPRTFRLTRLRTHAFTRPDPLSYRPTGPARQDLAYTYDLVGNVESITERTPGCGVPGTQSGVDQLRRDFGYDPLYRLLTATGRECAAGPADPFDPTPRCTDVTRSRLYRECYAYDAEGNLTTLRHVAGTSSSVRSPALVAGGNRLASVGFGATSLQYGYDAAGNLTTETTSRRFGWDHASRLREFRVQPPGGPASVQARYLYDSFGRRVKKLVRKSGRVETTVYVGALFEHCRVSTGGTVTQNTTVHVLDGESRIAEFRAGMPFPDDATPAVKYHHGDHLGSSPLVTDAAGAPVNREELTPYGETSFGSYARKRYRFTGRERDEESGLSYHGARYYAPWLARWASPDPAGPVDGANLYRYARDNPVRLTDLAGTQDEESSEDSIPIGCDPTYQTCAEVTPTVVKPTPPAVRPAQLAEPARSEPKPPAPLQSGIVDWVKGLFGKGPTAPTPDEVRKSAEGAKDACEEFCDLLRFQRNLAEGLTEDILGGVEFDPQAMGGALDWSQELEKRLGEKGQECTDKYSAALELLKQANAVDPQLLPELELVFRQTIGLADEFFDCQLLEVPNEVPNEVPSPSPGTPNTAPDDVLRRLPGDPFPFIPWIPVLPLPKLPPLPTPAVPALPVIPLIIVPPGYFDPEPLYPPGT
ncbi:MAG: SpvB/TcaC N-terminal domain-containing protein [Dehalococcoidia bacterium]